MPAVDHRSARTQFLEAGGFRYAYRRFGVEAATPLLFLQHFRGSMDNWDPSLTDGLAAGRQVILFDNAGVSSTSGDTPETVEEMADHVAAFIDALGITQLDVLGFSIGGFVAQEFVMRHPQFVRRLVLAGTGPRGGVPATDPHIGFVATRNEIPSLEDFQFLFFSSSQAGQAAGRAFWKRRLERTSDVEPPASRQTMLAQVAALAAWGNRNGVAFSGLAEIGQKTLVVNGCNDLMVPTLNAYNLSQHIPDAQLIIYPDSGHGSIFQYPELFLAHAKLFLDS